MSIDGWIKKWWCRYAMEYYSAIRNEIGSLAVIQMNPESVIQSEVRKTNIIHYCIYVESRKWY